MHKQRHWSLRFVRISYSQTMVILKCLFMWYQNICSACFKAHISIPVFHQYTFMTNMSKFSTIVRKCVDLNKIRMQIFTRIHSRMQFTKYSLFLNATVQNGEIKTVRLYFDNTYLTPHRSTTNLVNILDDSRKYNVDETLQETLSKLREQCSLFGSQGLIRSTLETMFFNMASTINAQSSNLVELLNYHHSSSSIPSTNQDFRARLFCPGM